MPSARTANAVRLEFTPASLVQANLSGAAFNGDWLWVARDEACGLDRLRRLDPVAREVLRFGPCMAIPGKDNGFDIEGPAVDGCRLLLGLRDPVRFEAALTESVSLPHGRGTNRAAAICDLPPALSGGKASWLVLYDAPRAERKEGEHIVFGDLRGHD
jgi:hypothetical protein